VRHYKAAARYCKWILVAGFVVLGARHVNAQQMGTITGTVSDSTGAVISGAAITVTNTATQQVRPATTTDAGAYTVPYLLPGNYEVKAEKAGFKVSTHAGVDVQVGGVARVDFAMEVGTQSQQVVVSTGVPLVSTESVSLGTVIENKQITDLPLNGRDYLSLVALSPNVVSEAPSTAGSTLQGGVRAATALSVAGQRLEFNHYTLDGVENTDPNFNSYIIHPSIDALQEFRVQTGVYSAEFGKGASQINVTTRSGTNAYHLVAFEFLRNDWFDAKEWRQTGPKDPFRRNDYGFTLGGPISIPKLFNGKDRLFFMSNFEGLHDRLTTQEVASFPTLAMRAGNFSAPGIPQIYDPLTRVFTSTGGTATPFPGNIIPANRISPQALAILNYLPPPTYPGNSLLGPNGTGNFVRQALAPTDSTQFTQRVDWSETEKISWFGRFSWQSDFDTVPAPNLTDTLNVPTTVRQAVVGNTYTISPTVVNQARFAWDQFDNAIEGYYANTTNVQATLGITGLYAASPVAYGLPTVGLGGGVSGFGGGSPYVTKDQIFQGTDSLSIIRGRHTITVGGEIRRDRYNQNGNQKATGEVDFDGASTNNPGNPAATGYITADFMLGFLSQYYRVIALANGQLRRNAYAAFIQDDWKATSKITVNAGLRYENARPWVDKYYQMFGTDLAGGIGVATAPWGGLGTTPASTLIPNTTPVVITRPGPGNFYDGVNFRYANAVDCNEIGVCDSQTVQRGNQYMGNSLVQANNLSFGPRVGINYSPTSLTTFRAAYGIFFAQDIGNPLFDQARNLGGKDGTPVPTNARTVTLNSPWASEASTSPVNCPGWTGACLIAPQIQTFAQHNVVPYVEQYLLNVQHQVNQDTVLEFGYLGNAGHHLNRDVLYNQAIPKSGPTDPTTITQRKPFPAYGNFQTDATVVNSTYNAFSVKLSQRVAHGLSYLVGFTWSKSIDDGSAVRPNGNNIFIPTNTYNLRAERGVSQFDLPHRFVASYLYALPFGRGQRFASTGLLNYIIGGWQFGGILTLADGTGYSYTQLADLADIGTPQGNQPDYTGVSPIPAHRSAAEFWNVAAANVTNADLSWRMGSMGRNTLRTPGSEDFDSSLTKDFHIWETHTLNFRFEAFNTFNHPNWNPPSADARNAETFGVVTSAISQGSGAERQLQFALKYSF
jgi:Carboxypeptidase regulatory-like domain